MARGALVLGADGTDAGVKGVTAGVSAFKQQPAAKALASVEEQLPSSSLTSEDSTWRPAGGKVVPCMAEELELQVEDLQSLWHDSEAVSVYSGQCVGSRRAMRQAGLQPSWAVGGNVMRKPAPAGVPRHSQADDCWAGGCERPSSPALLVVPKAAAPQLQPASCGTWVSPLERLPLPKQASVLRSRSRSSVSTDAEDDDVPMLISGVPATERLLNSISLSPPPPPASGPVGSVPRPSESPPPQARQQGTLDSRCHDRRQTLNPAPQDGNDSNDSHESEQCARLLSRRQESDSSSDELESKAVMAIALKPSMHRQSSAAGSTKRLADGLAGDSACAGAEAMVSPSKIPRSSSSASVTHLGSGPGTAAGGPTGPAGKRRATSARATAAALAKQRKRSGGGRGTGPLAPTMPGQCCSICHTQATPVWRAGPLGPKTLCNACGVRYMKTVKPRR